MWVYDGKEVLLEYIHPRYIACVVKCAAGNNARVVNEEYEIDKWVNVEDLADLPESKHVRKEDVPREQGVLHPVEP